MTKILYVCCNFTYGGVEQYILNTLDTIEKSKFEIDILLPDGRVYDREQELLERGVRVIKYRYSNYLEKCVEFYRIVKSQEYDIIHFHTGHESALLTVICRLAKQKNIIVHAHTSMSGDEKTGLLHGPLKKIVFLASEYIYKWLTFGIACSVEAAQFMFGKFAKKAYVMENGIDLERFWCERKRQGENFCINARFDMQKNPFFVVDIMEELLKIRPNVSLRWIGTGVLMQQVREKIHAAGLEDKIFLLGSRNDVEQILFESDFFLLPSLYEGLGIVLIEAQAAGLQCFISDAIPSKADCGGCIVIPLQKSPKYWAEKIAESMDSKNPPEIDRTMLQAFSICDTTKKLEDIYTSIVERS